MNTRIMPLTDAKIRNAKPSAPIKLADAKGLYLEIRPTGAKLWRYRYRIEGKENVFALGEYFNNKRFGHVSLDFPLLLGLQHTVRNPHRWYLCCMAF
jgi:hypothetical protein